MCINNTCLVNNFLMLYLCSLKQTIAFYVSTNNFYPDWEPGEDWLKEY
jgi:hypothetical protein